MNRVEVAGIHLLAEGASGTPVLLLHGIGGAAETFAAQLPALAERHQVYAWDAPGYGASADPTAAPGMSGYADVAANVLGKLDAGPAHVVGVSWGGVIATRLAATHPGKVRSLTLADSSRGSGRVAKAATAMRERATELAEVRASEFAKRRGPRLVSPHARPSVVDSVVDTMAKVRLPGYRFAAESMADTDHSGLLGRIDAPTLVVVGADDRVTGVAESRELAAGIPGARLEIIPCAGHAANQERPDQFNRRALSFFDHAEQLTKTGAL